MSHTLAFILCIFLFFKTHLGSWILMLIPCRTSCGYTGPLGYLTGLKVNYRCVSFSFNSKREAYRFTGRSAVCC